MAKCSQICKIKYSPNLALGKPIVFVFQLNGITTQEELNAFLVNNSSVRETLTTSGWVKNITMQNKGCAAQNLLVHEVLTKRKMAMDQLRKGLQCLDMCTLLARNPDMMKVYFVSPDEEHLTPEIMIQQVFSNAGKEEEDQDDERSRNFFVQSLTNFFMGEYLFSFHNFSLFWAVFDLIINESGQFLVSRG